MLGPWVPTFSVRQNPPLLEVFAIGAANRERGCAATKLSLVWKKWREYSRLAATYPAAD